MTKESKNNYQNRNDLKEHEQIYLQNFGEFSSEKLEKKFQRGFPVLVLVYSLAVTVHIEQFESLLFGFRRI